MKTILVLALMVVAAMAAGCAPRGHWVHYSLTQEEVNKVDFQCRYMANMMSHEYRSAIVSGMVQGQEFGRCMQANGFVFQQN